jgi:hypothetical protein
MAQVKAVQERASEPIWARNRDQILEASLTVRPLGRPSSFLAPQ